MAPTKAVDPDNNLMTERIISQARYPWVKRMLLPYVVVFTLITLISDIDYLLISGMVIIFIAHYLFLEQFHFANYFLTEKNLIIQFPVSFVQKTKIFTLSEIKNIEFNFHPSMYGSPYCKVRKVDGSEEKVFCSGSMDMARVIEDLQKMNLVSNG